MWRPTAGKFLPFPWSALACPVRPHAVVVSQGCPWRFIHVALLPVREQVIPAPVPVCGGPATASSQDASCSAVAECGQRPAAAMPILRAGWVAQQPSGSGMETGGDWAWMKSESGGEMGAQSQDKGRPPLAGRTSPTGPIGLAAATRAALGYSGLPREGDGYLTAGATLRELLSRPHPRPSTLSLSVSSRPSTSRPTQFTENSIVLDKNTPQNTNHRHHEGPRRSHRVRARQHRRRPGHPRAPQVCCTFPPLPRHPSRPSPIHQDHLLPSPPVSLSVTPNRKQQN